VSRINSYPVAKKFSSGAPSPSGKPPDDGHIQIGRGGNEGKSRRFAFAKRAHRGPLRRADGFTHVQETPVWDDGPSPAYGKAIAHALPSLRLDKLEVGIS
jgi:hypothetical protein